MWLSPSTARSLVPRCSDCGRRFGSRASGRLAEVPHSVCIIDEAAVRFVRAAASLYAGMRTVCRGRLDWDPLIRLIWGGLAGPDGFLFLPGTVSWYLLHTVSLMADSTGVEALGHGRSGGRILRVTRSLEFRRCGGSRVPGAVVETRPMNQNGLIPPFFDHRGIRPRLHSLGILSTLYESVAGFAGVEGCVIMAGVPRGCC